MRRLPAGVSRAALLGGTLLTGVGGAVKYPEAGRGVTLLLLGLVLAAAALLGGQAPAVQVPSARALGARAQGARALGARAVAGERGPRLPGWVDAQSWLAIAALWICVGINGRLLAEAKALPTTVLWAGVAVVLVTTALSGRPGRPGWAAALLTVAVVVAGDLVAIRHVVPVIDVTAFQHLGAERLLAGGNPWSMTFPNVYVHQPGFSHDFYAPQVVAGDRVLFGFPYPPLVLLAAVPGYLLGDVRYSHLAALAVAAVLLRAAAGDAAGRRLALLVVLLPGTFEVVDHGWTEPVLVVALAAAVLGLVRGSPAAPYLVGVLMVAKQYMVLVLPLLWLLPSMRRRAALMRAAAAGAVLTVPFIAWGPAAFWHSVGALQFLQPYRKDSISLLAWSVNTWGWPPPAVYGVLPLVGAFGTAVLLAWRAPRTPAGFAGSLGLTLLVMVLLSKQAFMNYYFLVTAALAVSVVTWPVPAADDERLEASAEPPSSQPAGAPEPRRTELASP